MRNVTTFNFRAVVLMLLIQKTHTLATLKPIATPPPTATLIEHSFSQDKQNRNAWGLLVPTILERERYIDVSVHWLLDEGCCSAAEQCVSAIEQQLTSQKRRSLPRNLIKESIALSMESFVAFCSGHHLQPNGFKARLVGGRGTTSAKCPRWHVDHVPARFIQSFIGPGCQYLECTGPLANFPHRSSNLGSSDDVNDSDSSSLLHDYVEILVQRHPDCVHQVPEGDAVILIGNEWPNNILPPCVHKSPSGLMPWEGRILFTIDTVVD